jgi:hypothetical protein
MKSYFHLAIGVFTLLAITVLLLSPAYAVPPVQTSASAESLQIAYPQYQFVQLDKNFTLSIHVFNISNYITGTTASCYLDMYDPMGEEAAHSRMIAGVSDYSLSIAKGNFSILGVHSFIIQCNTSSQSGFANGIFEVNALGIEFTTARAILNALIFTFSILVFIGLLIMGIATPSGNKSDAMTGYILAVSNLKYFKIVCLGLAYLVAVFIAYFCWMMSYAYTALIFVSEIFRIIFMTLAVLTLPLFILLAYLMIANAIRDSKIADALSRGLSYKDDD